MPMTHIFFSFYFDRRSVGGLFYECGGVSVAVMSRDLDSRIWLIERFFCRLDAQGKKGRETDHLT